MCIVLQCHCVCHCISTYCFLFFSIQLFLVYCFQFSRNWFLERIQLLCDDILTSNEKSLRESIKWTKMNNRLVLKDSYKEIADTTQEFLERGVTVLCHTPEGDINESTLYYNAEERRLVIKKTGGFFKFATQERGINISDIFSLRPGTHSYSFVQSKSQNEKQENVSVIIILYHFVYEIYSCATLMCLYISFICIYSACLSLVPNVQSTSSCLLSGQGICSCTRSKCFLILCIFRIGMLCKLVFQCFSASSSSIYPPSL